MLVIGFIMTEIILFGQGTLLWAGLGYVSAYYEIIFGASILLPLGILIATLGQRNQGLQYTKAAFPDSQNNSSHMYNR